MAFSFAPLPLSHPDEILHDHSPFILIHKNGRIERLVGEELSSPGTDQDTGVQSKDVLISPETGLRARLYTPGTITSQKQKLAVLIYFHGGGFVVGSAFSALFQSFHNKLALEANVIILLVDYRNAPEHVYPAPQEDAWAAMHWVASHANGEGNEPLLNEYADLRCVFLGGESAGATIAHHLGMRLGLQNGLVSYEDQVKVAGIVLIHPYFWGETPIGDEVNADVRERNVLANLWRVANPSISGLDDPFVNPGFDPDLSKLGCTRVLVCVAEKDLLRDRGLYYHDVLKKSGWEGQVDIVEAKGEGHAFHIFTPFRENAITLFKTLSSFINGTNKCINGYHVV